MFSRGLSSRSSHMYAFHVCVVCDLLTLTAALLYRNDPACCLLFGFCEGRWAVLRGWSLLVHRSSQGEIAFGHLFFIRVFQHFFPPVFNDGVPFEIVRRVYARCYWEMGGQFREDRSYCFNALLKAAKLSPSNAEVSVYPTNPGDNVSASPENVIDASSGKPRQCCI